MGNSNFIAAPRCANASGSRFQKVGAIPELLRTLDLSGAIMTIDAAGCQVANAGFIRGRGGYYLLAVKGKLPTLRSAVKRQVEEAREAGFVGVLMDGDEATDDAHGRHGAWRVTVIRSPEGIPADWPNVAEVVQVNRERSVDGERTCASRYHLTSYPGMAAEIASRVRGHWGIGNSLPRGRDLVPREDASRVRSGPAGENLAMIRRGAVALPRRAPGKGEDSERGHPHGRREGVPEPWRDRRLGTHAAGATPEPHGARAHCRDRLPEFFERVTQGRPWMSPHGRYDMSWSNKPGARGPAPGRCARIKLASRPPLQRIAEIDRLVRAEAYPNAGSLARGLEVCRRTAQRDLEFLRDRLGAPLEFVTRRRGYRYTDPTYRLPFWNLTEGELVALFLADGVLRRYGDTPFGPDLERAIAKVVGGLEDQVRVDLGALADSFSSHEASTSEIDAPLFEALTRSFRRSERLRIVYDSGGKGVETTREVDPYTLATVGGAWYLVAFCHLRDEVRMFTPSRIRAIEGTGRTFVRPADFRLAEYLSTSLGVLRGEPGSLYSIRLRFTGDAARHVRGRKWHPSQTLEDAGEGAVVLGFELSHLREAERWALSWMPDCEVLAPAELRERVGRACGEGYRNNRAEETGPAEVEERTAKRSKKRKENSS